MGTGNQLDGLYFCGSSANSYKVCFNSSVEFRLWHARLGHSSSPTVNVLRNSLNLKQIEDSQPCEVCHQAKQHAHNVVQHLGVSEGLIYLQGIASIAMIRSEILRMKVLLIDDRANRATESIC